MARRRRKTSRRRRPVRPNKLSTPAKTAALGTLVVAGGVGAYFLLRPSTASAQTPPTSGGGALGPGGGGAVPVAACQLLASQLFAYRGGARPDPTIMAQKETALAECLAQAGDAGPFLGNLSAGDQLFAQINGKFQEFHTTDYSDILKRNNIRGDMLRAGEQMAAKYSAAADAARSDAELQGVRQSILRAFDAAMTRKLCYLYSDDGRRLAAPQRGCGRYPGSTEPDGDSKARETQSRVIDKLMAANAKAVRKLGGAGRERIDRGSSEFLRILLRPCDMLRKHINAEFAHYRSTDYSDPLKRNNTRQTILVRGASLANCLKANLSAAKQHRNISAVSRVAQMTDAAIQDSIARWVCYKDDQNGCGRSGVSEAHGNDKANDERTKVLEPLFAVYRDAAGWLRSTAHNDSAYVRLAAMRVQLCNAQKARIDREFSHYKAVSYIDPLQRNNTRSTMLSVGAAMATCFGQALADASGNRGATKTVSDSVLNALDAAMSRKLCYRNDAPGCGRSGLSEPHGNDKANDVQTKVIAPLASVARAAAAALAGFGDTSADVRLAQILLRDCDSLRDYANRKFVELKSVSYTDPVRRNNIRGDLLSHGQQMVRCLQAQRPTTASGKAVVKTLAQRALSESQAREACLRAGASGCGRFGVIEPDEATKANDEATKIRQPLQAILGSSALRGLGEPPPVSNAPIYLLGAAAIATLYYLGS